MDGVITNILYTQTFTGEDGIEYVKVTKEILTPRKTYAKGEISGKYRGDKLFLESARPNMSLFDFEIYEASVICESRENFRKDKPFKLKDRIEFPREKLPKHIPVSIEANGATYDVNILEPSLYDFESIRKFRQIHGDEVYGHFTAYITGYIFDYEKKEEVEIHESPEYIAQEEAFAIMVSPLKNVVIGPEETNGSYTKKNVYNNRGETSSSWILNTNTNGYPAHYGCMSGAFGFIGLVLVIFFLIVAIPNFFYLLLIAGIFFLFHYLSPILKWVLRIVGAAFLIFFIFGVFATLGKGVRATSYVPKTLEDERETINPIVPNPQPTVEPTDPEETAPKTDRLIKRFRSWTDYEGKQYEGYYTIRQSDFENSHSYKTEVRISGTSMSSYDQLIFLLKEKDKNSLNGLYNMLDSLRTANQLSDRKFAEMAVAMVQDIPYSLVLDKDCKADLYQDPFISQWLSKPDGWCDPYQRFGINTPVEFISNLKGDCDSRTLMLYTVLSHYGYDVVLLSSEIYKHSLIGINLPLNGAAYTYQGTRYILWETTSTGIRPGIISPEMSNMNYWRISLKSKTE